MKSFSAVFFKRFRGETPLERKIISRTPTVYCFQFFLYWKYKIPTALLLFLKIVTSFGTLSCIWTFKYVPRIKVFKGGMKDEIYSFTKKIKQWSPSIKQNNFDSLSFARSEMNIIDTWHGYFLAEFVIISGCPTRKHGIKVYYKYVFHCNYRGGAFGNQYKRNSTGIINLLMRYYTWNSSLSLPVC